MVRSCDTSGVRAGSSSVIDVPGRSKGVPGGDSGICMSREESLLLKGEKGLKCFFSAFLSYVPGDGPTTLFRLFMTVPSRLRPPRGVCLGWASGAMGKRSDTNLSNFRDSKLTWGSLDSGSPLGSFRPLASRIILNVWWRCKWCRGWGRLHRRSCNRKSFRLRCLSP